MDLIKKAKDAETVVLSLIKKSAVPNQEAYVQFDIDTSGSMTSNFSSGFVQKVAERILPLGMAFDDDQAVDVRQFSNGSEACKTPMTLSNFQGFINKEMKPHFYGTDYSDFIKAAVADWKSKTGQGGGLLGMFKSKPSKILPSLVFVLTDGNTSNQSAVTSAIIEASKFGVFFVIVGIGNERFSYLQEMDNMTGRTLDNVSTIFIRNEQELVNTTDEQFYTMILKEFPQWCLDAAAKGIIS